MGQPSNAPSSEDGKSAGVSRSAIVVAAVILILIAGVSVYSYLNSPARPIRTMSDEERVASFRRGLFSEDHDRRKSAAEHLAGLGEPGVAMLVEGLRSEDPAVRRTAALALPEAGDAAQQTATALLRDGNPEVAAWSAWALGRIGSQESWRPLSEAALYWVEHYDPNAELIDPQFAYRPPYNPTERAIISAVKALGLIGNPRAADALQKVASSAPPEAARAAGEALQQLRRHGEKVPTNLASADQMQDREALLSALDHNQIEIKLKALEGLEELGDPSVCDEVRPLLQHDNMRVRTRAVQVVRKYRDRESVDELVAMLRGDVGASSPAAPIRALGEIGDPAAVPCLIEQLHSDRPGNPREAAEALGRIGDPAAIDALIEATKHESEHVRGHAAEALGLIGDPRAIDAVAAVVRDEYSGARRRAVHALIRIDTEEAQQALTEAGRVSPTLRREIARHVKDFEHWRHPTEEP